MATAAKSKGKAPARKKRTKGTSDKIRALAAMSVGRKVGYLTISDLTGGDDPKIENAINDPLRTANPQSFQIAEDRLRKGKLNRHTVIRIHRLNS